MATFQTLAGKVVSSVTTVVGSTVHLKLVPDSSKKERVPIPISIRPVETARVEQIKVRERANFTTFSLVAKAAGKAILEASTGGPKPLAGPVPITVESQVSLPSASTEQGLLARLLIAETPSPESSGYSDAAAEKAMIWMRVVVANRLAQPSGLYGSAGAKTMSDVVKSPGQFQGFGDYPTIAKAISDRIQRTVDIANDGNDPRRAKYKSFVDIVLRVANMSAVKDPSKNGLYFWRTEGSGPPSANTEAYATVLGNTFYMLKK